MSSYSQPPTEPPPLPSLFEPGPDRISISECLSRGWDVAKARYGLFIGAIFLSLLISIAASFLPMVGSFSGVFLAPMHIGIAYMFIRTQRGEQVELSSMWHPFRFYWPVVGIQFLVGLAGTLCYVPIAAAAFLFVFAGVGRPGIDEEVLIVGGIIAGITCVACVVAGLYLTGRMGFASLAYMDAPPGSLTVTEAIKASWEHTAPFAWKLVGLQALLFAILGASFLLLVVGGFLLGYPLIYGATGAAYIAIFRRKGDLCRNCGYDLRGTPGVVCPECGVDPTPIPAG